VSLLSGQDGETLPPMPEVGLESVRMADGPMGLRLGGKSENREYAGQNVELITTICTS
jgi:hypothetical protein